MEKQLVREVIDYCCIIRLWKTKGYYGEIMYYQTIHPMSVYVGTKKYSNNG